MTRILLADDQETVRRALATTLPGLVRDRAIHLREVRPLDESLERVFAEVTR